jgi:uncharacterized protein (DUF1778 family)
MYPHPDLVRAHRINIRLDRYEVDLLQAMANYQGTPLATLIRNLALQQALEDLALSADPKSSEPSIEDAKQQL